MRFLESMTRLSAQTCAEICTWVNMCTTDNVMSMVYSTRVLHHVSFRSGGQNLGGSHLPVFKYRVLRPEDLHAEHSGDNEMHAAETDDDMHAAETDGENDLHANEADASLYTFSSFVPRLHYVVIVMFNVVMFRFFNIFRAKFQNND